MLKAITPVAALLVSVALLLMGNGLQGTLLPVRATIENFTELDIGVMGSAYFLGFALGCIYGPHLVVRVGHIRTFTALVAIASTVALAHALLVTPFLWWPLRAITGFCFAGLYVVIESWLNERATNETRGMVMSVYTMVNLTVMTAGQLMLMLYDPALFPLFALASILVSIAAVPVALTRSPAPAPVETVHLRPIRLYRLSPVGFFGCFAVGGASGAFWTLGPVFAGGVGLNISGIAIFMSVTVIAGAIMQWPLGRASDKMDRRKVIVIASSVAGLAGIGLGLANIYRPEFVLGIAFLFGGFSLPLYALAAAHANDHIAPEEFVEASSGLLLANGIGSIIGPLIASGLMQADGLGALFYFTAFVHFSIASFTIYRMYQRPALPPEARPDFVIAPESSAHTVYAMDPRAEDTPAAE